MNGQILAPLTRLAEGSFCSLPSVFVCLCVCMCSYACVFVLYLFSFLFELGFFGFFLFFFSPLVIFRYEGIVCSAPQISLRDPGLKLVATG